MTRKLPITSWKRSKRPWNTRGESSAMSKRLNNEIARHWLAKLPGRRPWRGTARDLARQYSGGDTGRARRIIKRAQKLAADEGMDLDFHPKINSWRIAPAGDNPVAREMLAYKLSLA